MLWFSVQEGSNWAQKELKFYKKIYSHNFTNFLHHVIIAYRLKIELYDFFGKSLILRLLPKIGPKSA